MTYTGINSEEAYQAIQEKIQVQKDRGYGIIEPGSTLETGSYAVTINSGALNVSDTLTVGTSGDEALHGGDVVSLSAATDVGINDVSVASDGTEQYRYDIIWVDSSGEVQKTEGTAVKLSTEEANNNLTNFQRFRAAIPEPATYPSAVVAAVVVSSEDSSIGSDNLRDFRIDANSLNNKVSALELNGPVTSSNTISDLVGPGLEVVSNSLGVLSTIWDGTNLVADVVNSLVRTEEIENKTYTETTPDASISGATDVDLTTGNLFAYTVTADVTLSFINPSTGTYDGNSFTLVLEFDADHSVTFPSSTEWQNGVAPTLNTDFDSAITAITPVTPATSEVSVQTQSIDTGEVVLYDGTETELDRVPANSGAWEDTTSVGGTDVEFVQLIDAGQAVTNETISVNNDTGGTGGTTETADVTIQNWKAVLTFLSPDGGTTWIGFEAARSVE